MEILKNSLDQPNQPIDVNNYEHPISTLAKNFHKPKGEANPHLQLEYIPQTIFKYTWGQVSVSINADPIRTKQNS